MDGNMILKSSSFNVKDILDLPEGKLACSPVSTGTTTTGALRTMTNIPDIGPVDYHYDPTDNPYTRWLHSNNSDVMQYTRKYFFFFPFLTFYPLSDMPI